MKQINVCHRCGGELELSNGKYRCCYCNATYEEERVNDIKEGLNAVLDDVKQEKISNLRRLLWEAVHEKYQSKEKIIKIAQDIRSFLPDDFIASFYEIVNTKSASEINDYLNNIDTNRYYDLMDLVIEYLLKTVEYGNLLSLNVLIENTYKDNDLILYEKYASKLSEVSNKLEKGIYDLDLTRDVFVAYSSKDMKYVKEVVESLEAEGISCFVAMRNLRHGIGAVENYDKALEKAIDNSKIFLLVSTPNSRNRGCDAFIKEMPYVKKKDIDNAPAQFKYDYSKMPYKYKKPRIQLLIGDKPGSTIADRIVSEFFNGIEWCYSTTQVAEVIYKILDERVEDPEEEKAKKAIEEAERLKEELERVKKEKEQEALERKKEEEKAKKALEEAERLRKENEAVEAEKTRQENDELEKLRKELERIKKEKEEAETERLRKEKEEAEAGKIRKEKEEAEAEKIRKEIEKLKSEIKKTQQYQREGNNIIFGSYRQDKKQPEPLKWNILEEKDGKALIITDKIIDAIKFDDKSNNYEKSYIRNWLNNDFYNKAFSNDEKNIIQVTNVDNSLASTLDRKNKYICNNTNDKIFLLSLKEATTYYKSDNERKCKGTIYAKDRGLYVDSDNGNSWWWLRSPYYVRESWARYVHYYGVIGGNDVSSTDYGVRAACWINL